MAESILVPARYPRLGRHDMAAFRAASMQPRFVDLTGRRFGMTEVLAFIGKGYWHCRCDCGNGHRAYSGNLKRGATRSCGCNRTPRTPTADRFWAKVLKDENGCWEWQAGRTEEGYGTFNINQAGDGSDRSRIAHRYSWELHYGPIPDGMSVLHHCDNPPCVRPDDLFLGTHDDNMADMASKGRAPGCPERKLTDLDVMEIRDAARRGVRLADIAEQFNIGRGYAWAITNGRRR